MSTRRCNELHGRCGENACTLKGLHPHLLNDPWSVFSLHTDSWVDTTVELANKVGAAEIISRIVDDLKDEAEQYRKMVMETIEKIMGNLGAADIDHKLEEQLISTASCMPSRNRPRR